MTLSQLIGCIATDGRLVAHDELRSIRRKQSWPILRHCHSVCLEDLRKVTKPSVMLACLWAENHAHSHEPCGNQHLLM